MLWTALYFPQLYIDRLCPGPGPGPGPGNGNGNGTVGPGNSNDSGNSSGKNPPATQANTNCPQKNSLDKTNTDINQHTDVSDQASGRLSGQLSGDTAEDRSGDLLTEFVTPYSAPLAVVVKTGNQSRVMSANESARHAGIRAGLALNSAYAIVPDLQTVDYDPVVQAQHLEHLCLWALQYSSWVTPRLPDTLLIETEASLHLFGGLENFVKTLRHDAAQQGLTLQLGIAPTPAAASLFANVGEKTGVLTTQRLQPVLGDISIQHLPLNERTLKGLHKSGIKYCRDLFTIPAPALTRRFGQPCRDLVQRLLGDIPEVCTAFSVPDTFSERLDLPLEAPDVQALQFPLNRLMSALGGFLRTHDSGVKSMVVTLHHHKTQNRQTDSQGTQVTIKFLEATADYRHLYRIVTERLQQTTLTQSITAITLATDELETVARDERDLFQKSLNQSASVNQVIDNLSARLGRHKLYSPSSVSDHRPERSWSPDTPVSTDTDKPYPARPLWLLQHPTPSNKRLVIKSSAERIENGWWETLDVRRDYYIAEDQHGVHYWVYSERREPGVFFIHGIFA